MSIYNNFAKKVNTFTMATTNDTIDLKDRCLLVSDSDEIQTQMDSKKLPYSTLVDMA